MMAKRKYFSLPAFLFLSFSCCLALSLAACEKSEQNQAGVASEKTASPAPPTRKPVPSTTLPPEGQSRQTQQDVISLSPSPDSSRAAETRTLTTETGLFAYFPQQRLAAQDFKIGPLQDTLLAPLEFVKASAVVGRFFASLMKKEPDYGLVGEKSRRQLEAVVSYPLSQGYIPEKYRLGKMSFEAQDEIRANIRLFKGDAVTEGEIYLEKSGEDWLISDLQVGFTLLNRAYRKSSEPFMPGGYDFLLDE